MTQRRSRFLLCCTLGLSVIAAPSHAQSVGQIISYQGLLTGAGGLPVADGPQSLTFRIFEDNTVVFSQTSPVVAAGGVFNAFLSVGSLSFDPTKKYELSITFGGEETRHPIAAVPVAVNAKNSTAFTGPLTGDVGGTQGATKVEKIQGTPVAATAPANGQVLRFNAATGKFEPSSTTSGTVTAVTASGPLASSGGATPDISLTGVVPVANGGTGSNTQNFVDLTTAQTVGGDKTFSSPIIGTLQGNATTATNATNFTGNLAGDVTGTQSATLVERLRGTALSSTAPTSGQVLAFDGTNYTPKTLADATVQSDGTTIVGDGSAATPLKVNDGGIGQTQVTGGYVDLTTAQTVRGAKTFASPIIGNLQGNATTATTARRATIANRATNFTGNLAGDVTGTQSATVVSGIQGQPVVPTAPTAGQSLVFNGTTNQYEPATPAAATVQGDGTTITGDGSAANPLKVADAGIGQTQVAGGFVDLTTAQMVGGAKTFTSPVNTTTQYNIGAGAGERVLALIGGANSMAVGVDAGTNNTGVNNAFVGASAGQSNTTGINNAFVGALAGQNNITASDNAFVGTAAGFYNTRGNGNAFVGAAAGYSNTVGSDNAFLGWAAGSSNTMGASNAFVGSFAGSNTTTGAANAFIGARAGLRNTTGSDNIALGYGAGQNLTTGDNNIAIGNNGVAGEANTTRIGTAQTRAFIAGIRGVGITDGRMVMIDADGQLGTFSSSSSRFKQDIADIGADSDWVFKLRPVSFRYTASFLHANAPSDREYGLIAEEVAQVNPNMVHFDAQGQPDGVQYQNLPIMLLNQVQRQQKTIDALLARLAWLEAHATVSSTSAPLATATGSAQALLNPTNGVAP